MNNQNKDEDIMPLSPEEIKAIGEIELGPSKHEQFLNEHYKKLLWGGIALGIAAGCVIAYFSTQNDRTHQAAAVTIAAMKADEPGKVATVEAYDPASLELLQKEYGETPAAATGELLKGISLLRNGGDTAAAIASLESVAAKSPSVLLQSRAITAIATEYMGNGKNEEASAAWKRVAQLPDNPYTALAYVCLGDIAKTSGDKDAARTYYEQAKAKCPYSALVRNGRVDQRLILLDVDAPEPVAPATAPATDGAGDNSWLNQDVSNHALDIDPATDGAGDNSWLNQDVSNHALDIDQPTQN